MTLRTRLWVGFATIVVLVIVAGALAVSAQRRQLHDQIDDRLLATPLPPGTRAPPEPGARGAAPVPASPQRVDDESISDLYVAVLNPDRTIRPVTIGLLLDDAPELASLRASPPAAITFRTVDGTDGRSRFRVLFLPGTDDALDAVVAVPIDDVEDTLRRLTLMFVGLAALVTVASLAIVSWVSRHGLRPLNEMTQVAEAISAGERDRRAEVVDHATEAGRLGTAFNVMLDERDRSEARLRRFVSNASHELRTPLTSIRGYVDLYRSGGFRDDGQLDDAMRRVQFEAERMNHLVEELLLLAKFDEETPLELTEVRLDDVAGDVAALTLAAHPEREIHVESPHSVAVTADRFRLHQAITALVDNAVRHTPATSPITIRAELVDEHALVSVIDQGPGLTDDEIAVVFERFHRGDASRSRATGGSGLGLAIARSIVEAHGGDLAVTSSPGDGATFTMRLPTHA